jgi:hypothetical protein
MQAREQTGPGNDAMTDGLSPPTPPRFIGTARLAGALRAQRWMWTEAVSLWLRRPPPSVAYARRLGEGRRFALHRGSWLSVLVPMVVFSQFVDVLVAQGAVQVAAPAGAPRLALHALLLSVSLWTVAWAVALRSAMRHVDHVLGPHALTLAIGFRQVCRLPLGEIADVRVIDHRAARGHQDWLDVHGLEPRDVTLVTALDKPTLLIELRPGATGAWCTRHGVARPLRRWIAVLVDDPAAMAAAVAGALPAPVTLGNAN